MLAYHWMKQDLTCGYGTEPAWTEGEERTIKGRKKISLCKYGYHSSPSPWAGLEYAPGPVLCLVEISEPVDKDDTKSVSKTRKLIKAIDVSVQLREFACDVAEEALNREVQAGRTVDERSRAAIEVARRYARGQASREDLAAAWSAAELAESAAAAAWLAVSAAAWSAPAPAPYRAWLSAPYRAWLAAAASAPWLSAASAPWLAALAEEKFNALMEPLFETAVPR